MSASLLDLTDTLRAMGYAVEQQDTALTLPGHWRVHQIDHWWVLSTWHRYRQRGIWERYGIYSNPQDAIEKGLELPCP